MQAINGIIKGKKAITPETARDLSQALGTSPEYWLKLEAAYRLDLLHEQEQRQNEIARKARLYDLAPVTELMKRQWIEVPDKRDLDTLETELCRFLKIPSLDAEPGLNFAARKTLREEPHTSSQIAWACRVKQIAETKQASAFSQALLPELITQQLSRYYYQVEDVRYLPDILKDYGIRFVVVKHLPQTRIDGATLWLDSKSPVVAISLRYDRLDHFWYTIMHELAHVIAGDGQEGEDVLMLDDNLVGKGAIPVIQRARREQIADEKARNWLIPEDDLSRFVRQTRPYYSKEAILAFARKISVHPCIIVGRLQHDEEIPWQNHRRLFTKIRDVLT